ncbi:hypothetical protein [Streptomyces sp. NRRL F-5123]|uniref:hypothetical protein n=1 Tax=Streptomyces sp. NRRL F-5123 TaxID=1463856 RepID=UPI0004E21112|nr:hypothetical protein [Streptomyces sp. NRRL F-5123]
MSGTDTAGLCEAVTLLPPGLRSALLEAHPDVDRQRVADELVCALEAHPRGEHFAVLYDDFAAPALGALWTRWAEGEPPATYWLRPDCTRSSPHREACGHFAAHTGLHTWEAATAPRRP